MSARLPVDSEKIGVDGYLEKSRIDSCNSLIYDKNGKVIRYTKKAIWTAARRLCMIKMIILKGICNKI